MCCLSYTANNMPTDTQSTWRASPLTGMVLTLQSQNILSSVSEKLNCVFVTHLPISFKIVD